MARRHYSDEERAAALAALKANGGNLTKTASEVGVPLSTLKSWRDNPDNSAPAELRNKKRQSLKNLIETRLRESLDALPDKLPAATYKDAATAIGILTDKLLLLLNRPTSIIKRQTNGPADDVERFTRAFERAADAEETLPLRADGNS